VTQSISGMVADLERELARLRASPAPLCTVDCEALVRLVGQKVDAWANDSDTQHEIKRKCADAIRKSFAEAQRPVDTERVARAIDKATDEACGRKSSDAAFTDLRRMQARAAISDLGLQIREPDASHAEVIEKATSTALGDAAAPGAGLVGLVEQLATPQRAGVTCSLCIEHDHEGPPEDAPASPAAQAGEWTEWQRTQAAIVSNVRPLQGEPGHLNATCAAIARVAHHFTEKNNAQ